MTIIPVTDNKLEMRYYWQQMLISCKYTSVQFICTIISLFYWLNCRLTEVTQADEGSYSCLAYNAAGEARVTASIEVQSPPEITLLPADSVTVRLGERIRLECRASGDPAPSVSFTRYGDTQ